MKSNHPDISLIRKYLNGELDGPDMYKLERQAQDDPMLMDVITGMEMGDRNGDAVQFEEISQRIRNRVAEKRSVKLIPWKTFSIAASFLIAIGFIAFFMLDKPADVVLVTQSKEVIRSKDVIEQAKPDTSVAIKEVPLPEIEAIKSNPTLLAVRKKTSRKVKAMRTEPGIAMADLARKDSIIYNAEALNEVVVVGYGVQKKTSITGSVSTIDTSLKAKDRLEDMLVGRVAGLSVSKRKKSEAKPLKKDADNSIRIRGMSTLTGDQKPLFIVDGMPYNGDINALDPKVISSFEVLKDASATALYGSRAANGVIIINTTNTLNEVVMAPKGAIEKQKPEPLVGWKAYERYLEKEATLGDKSKGKVTLTFTLGPEGKPLNLKVVKSDGDAMRKKAIELVTNGPKWHPGKGMNGKEIKLKVRFH